MVDPPQTPAPMITQIVAGVFRESGYQLSAFSHQLKANS
jgi:hypothetical protein